MLLQIKKRLLTAAALTLALIAAAPSTALADSFPAPPEVIAETAALMDVGTGKFLYDKDADRKIFPASTTKLLTALVALEYLKPGEYVVVGDEINFVPAGSSRARHIIGETIRVDNLIRLLIIPSGNDTACVIAMAVGRIAAGDDSISYAQAEGIFSDLMNEKAEALGARNSHFVNPHGFHDARHYTTARDMCLIAAAALENDLIRQISAETDFVGPGAGENPPEGAVNIQYTTETHNLLIVPGQYHYQYATGMKTGFTDEAGNCLVASAVRDGRTEISAVFFSTESERYTDTIALFDYGFGSFADEVVQSPGAAMETLRVSNPRLGDSGYVRTEAKGGYSAFLSKEELSRVERVITYKPELAAGPDEIVTPAPEDPEFPPAPGDVSETYIKPPIAAGDVVGRVAYTLDGETIFTDDIIALDAALERTQSTDVDHKVEEVRTWLLSPAAIPYAGGAAGVIVLIIIIAVSAAKRKRRNRSGRYHW
ncbi:MAG: D-alanyl-D-alanine carboxypeptidase [Clostridiales bacterium]|jgi:D-alanyl-D-alanine carboxypeptidase (penicillin-binding protein 5/6)|nr:D-alanyl-D-alanine carboxypeptidase [Clostridiales bacterium]